MVNYFAAKNFKMLNSLKNKVMGNTILEVLIALAIICFCSTLATLIYINIQKSSLSFFKIKAVELAEKRMKETVDKRIFTEELFKEEEFIVKRVVILSDQFPDCYLVRIIVFEGGKKKIHELETLVRKSN